MDVSGLDLIHLGKDVIDFDPNVSGMIMIMFSENVSGNISLQTEAGDDTGWLGSVKGNTASVEIIKGKALRDGETYIITGNVSDASGNELAFNIQFETVLHN